MRAAVCGGTEYAPVAQLDRAIASDAMCRAFESHQVYHVRVSLYIAYSDFFVSLSIVVVLIIPYFGNEQFYFVRIDIHVRINT